MHVIPTVVNVKESAELHRAVADEIGVYDNKDITRNFLDQMSVDYPGKETRHEKTLVEDPLNEDNKVVNDGQDFVDNRKTT